MKLSDEIKGIAPKYHDILKKAQFYVLSYPENFKLFDMNPFGLEIDEKYYISCIDSKRAGFFDALQTLDKLSFGPVGMPMEKWVFYDCGEMPGGIVGLGIPADEADDEVLERYGLDRNYTDIIPISMFISIPMASKNSWFGHNLCSANSFLKDKYSLSGLALLTKSFGVKVLGINDAFGATQWESGAVNIHSQLDDMEIRTAYTPAHSFPKTFTYKSHYTDKKLLRALSGESRKAESYDQLIDVSGEKFYFDLQEKIEAGEKFTLVGRPIYKDGKTFLPIKNS